MDELPSYVGPDRRSPNASELAVLLAEQARQSAVDLAERQAAKEQEAAEKRQQLAEKLAEERGRRDASLEMWQRAVETGKTEQDSVLKDLKQEVSKLTTKLEEIALGLRSKAANEVTASEFRKWAIGMILAAFGIFGASGGFKP